MLEDLKRSEANRKAHVCPEQPLAHLFSNSTPAMTGQVMRPDYEAMARHTDKRDLIDEGNIIVLGGSLNAEIRKTGRELERKFLTELERTTRANRAFLDDEVPCIF